jgi:putative DNA primase/helicase
MAAEIAAELGDDRREGRAWRCRCPLHGGRSLSLRDGDGGRLLITCWAGCDRLEVLAELRRRGLLDRRSEYAPRLLPTPRRIDNAGRTARALNIWRKAQPGPGTVVPRYPASRGIVFHQWPASLRFHPRCPRPRDDGGNFVAPLPAMVALVERVERGPVAVHCTYLRPDGTGKADLPKEKQKAMFGSTAGGAVRFGMPCAGEWLAIGEGIESTAAVVVARRIPGWAALSAGGIRALILPPEATHILICADHDANGVGARAAFDAADRWLAEGRRVLIAMPPQVDTDMADMLMADDMMGVRHVV